MTNVEFYVAVGAVIALAIVAIIGWVKVYDLTNLDTKPVKKK